MRRCMPLFVPFALCLGLALPRVARAADGPPRTLEQTFEEIGLLHQLNQLRLSGSQLQALRKARRELDAERRKLESRHDTPEIRAAANAVRQALLEERPQDELGPLFEKLEAARQGQGREEGEPGEILASLARDHARAFIASLRGEQVVRLVGEEPEDGLATQLVRELKEVGSAPPPAQKSYVSRTALRLSHELTSDVSRSGKARAELETLLERLLKQPDAEPDARDGAFAAELGQIVNRAVGSPLGEIQWRAERRLAGLLMHPRLEAVLDERLRLEGKGR